MIFRRFTASSATASPAVTRFRKRAAFKSLSKLRLTLRSPESSEVSETSTNDRSALSTLAAAAAVVIVTFSPSSSPPSPFPSERF